MKIKDEQIEEMANIIAFKAFEQAHLIDGDENLADIVATELYAKGYRKASEAAEEIFAEIEELMSKLDRRYMASGNPKQSWGVRGAISEIAELKKKYMEEGK